ncbi:MAG: TlpA family protein disulfide reductase [Alphaproteobacteria bacterium]|nr:TlpA family protein disulfide reductase [Alphaproteobacteria bacterium]
MRFPFVVGLAALAFAVAGYGIYLTWPAPSAPLSQSGSRQVSVAHPAGLQAAADAVRGFRLLANAPLAPDVKLKTEAGETVTLADYRGKVVLLNLWATWCPPCKREMPDLNALQTAFAGRDFVVLPVATGRQGAEEPSQFLRKRSLDALSTVYDPGRGMLDVLGIDSLPSTFLIDRDGRMLGGVLGMIDWNSDAVKTLIETVLKG